MVAFAYHNYVYISRGADNIGAKQHVIPFCLCSFLNNNFLYFSILRLFLLEELTLFFGYYLCELPRVSVRNSLRISATLQPARTLALPEHLKH